MRDRERKIDRRQKLAAGTETTAEINALKERGTERESDRSTLAFFSR